MSKNLSRKINSAMLSSLLLPGFFGLYMIFESGFSLDLFFLLIVLFFALIGNFFYAIPVSLLIDVITSKLHKHYLIVSAILHILFAFATIIFIREYSYFALFCALFFFLTEEWQKGSYKTLKLNQIISNGISLVVIVALAIYNTYLIFDLTEKKTKEYYIIPDGYVGNVTVLYNMKDEPKPKKVGDYNVITINELGYGLTSLPEAEGLIDNKYYYYDKDGLKEKIKENCIHIGSTGSTSNGEREFNYSSFTVINIGCSNHFSTYGSKYLEDHSMDVEEILQREGLGDFGY